MSMVNPVTCLFHLLQVHVISLIFTPYEEQKHVSLCRAMQLRFVLKVEILFINNAFNPLFTWTISYSYRDIGFAERVFLAQGRKECTTPSPLPPSLPAKRFLHGS